MRKNRQPKKISTFLAKVLEEMGAPYLFEEKKIKDNWSNVVGKRIAQIATIHSLKGDMLTVQVSNPAWRMELNFERTEILRKINQLFGWRFVKRIHFIS